MRSSLRALWYYLNPPPIAARFRLIAIALMLPMLYAWHLLQPIARSTVAEFVLGSVGYALVLYTSLYAGVGMDASWRRRRHEHGER